MQYQTGDKIGTGLKWPPEYRDGKFEELEAEDLVRNGIDGILNVDGASRDGVLRGELRFHMRLGSQLSRLTHMRMRGMEEDVGRVYVLDPLTRFEPRADIDLGQTSVTGSKKSDRSYVFKVVFSLNPEYSGRRSLEPQITEVER